MRTTIANATSLLTRSLAVWIGLTAASVGWAQEVAVPVDVQLPLLLKVLSYDRNLTAHGPELLTIGILYQSAHKPSAEIKADIMHLVHAGVLRTLDGIPLELVPIDISEKPEWPSALAFLSPEIVYVAPLRGVPIAGIATITRAHHIATVTGVPEYVDRGLAVGIGGREEKPLILINLPAALAEGMNIGSQALKLAELVGTPKGQHR